MLRIVSSGLEQTLKYWVQQTIRARQRKKLWIAKLSTSQKRITAETEVSENIMVRKPALSLKRYSKLIIPCTGSREDAVTLVEHA